MHSQKEQLQIVWEVAGHTCNLVGLEGGKIQVELE